MQLTKQHWVYITVTIGFLSQIFLSQTLWYSENRHFFLVPMFEALPFKIGNWGNLVIFISLLLTMIIGIFYQKRYLIGGIILSLAVLFLQDITRIQTWSYQYFLIFLVLIVDWKKSINYTLPALQFILIFTYFWSGIQKFNPHYIDNVHPWLFSAFDWLKPLGNASPFAYIPPLVEMLLGIGLIFSFSRNFTVVIGILMHILILVMIGPLGLDWNYIVYPWNIVMIVLLVILFWRKPNENENKNKNENGVTLKWEHLFRLPQSLMQWLILVTLGVLPVFNLFFRFPETISMTMYNGVTSELSVYFDQNEIPNCIPEVAQTDIYPIQNGNMLSLDDWALKEFNVVIYDLPTYAKKFGRDFCDCLDNPTNAGIKITNTKRWTRDNYSIIEQIDCKDL